MKSEPSSTPNKLEQEILLLRQEVAELRAVQTMHGDAQEGFEGLERQLASIMHSAMDGMITIDDEYRIVLFNAAAEEIFQCSSSDALGKTLDQFIPESMRQAHHEHLCRFAESGETYGRIGVYREIFGLRHSGEMFSMEGSISKFERGGKRWMTVMLRDTSQRKASEERAEYLGRILDCSLNEIYIFDATNWRFVRVNRGARENVGYGMDELFRMTPLDLMTQFTPDMFRDLLDPLQKGMKANVHCKTIHTRKDGTTYPVEAHLQHMRHEDRGVFVAMIVDVTEQVEMETQLQEAQRTLASLLTNMPGMVYRCDNNQARTMQFISPSCEELTGYPSKAFVEDREVSYGHDLIHPKDREQVWQEMQTALNDRRPVQLSYRLKLPDGSLKWVWEQSCGVFSQSGEILGCEGYVVDMTQQRTLEAQLRKTERLAELGTLASGMAHEIGTPMNVILGRAELLSRKSKDESTKRGLETIVTQVERITKIMNQLLSFARMRPSEQRGVDLTGIIGSVLDMLQEKFKHHDIHVIKEYSPDDLPWVWPTLII